MNRTLTVAVLSLGLICFGVAGCGDTDSGGTTQNNSESQTTPPAGENEPAGLAKLSPEDAASAREQKICPVSEEPLGSMGAPKKVEVQDQQVWICCEACREQLLENPEEHLAKLKKD